MAQGGRGLAKLDGKPVFVPYTLPGEAVTAEISGRRGSALFARGIQLQAASADRVVPRCSHFGPGRCWECQWQHIAYPAQLLLKQDVLADQLSRQGKLPNRLINDVLRPVLPAPEPWAYNHTLRLARSKNGSWGLRRDGGGFKAIHECLITHPDLLELLAQLDLDYPPARRMTLRRGGDGRLMLIFDVSAEEAPDLQTDLPLSVNLILPDREPINLVGDAFSHYTVAGFDFRITAGSSIRSNISGIEQLIDQVLQALNLQGGERRARSLRRCGYFQRVSGAADGPGHAGRKLSAGGHRRRCQPGEHGQCGCRRRASRGRLGRFDRRRRALRCSCRRSAQLGPRWRSHSAAY